MHLNLTNDIFYSLQYEAGASLILEGPDAWRFRPVAEVLAERAFGQSKGVAASALLGGIFRGSDVFSLDVAARCVSDEGTRGVELRAGFTWAFEVWRVQAPHQLPGAPF